jgi:hypothetical protein
MPYLIFGQFELLPYIPGNGVTDWLFLWYFIPILAIPFYLVMALITPRWLVLPLNRILNPGSEIYYYGLPTETPKPTYTMLRRAVFTLIITLGLSLTIARFVGWRFFTYTPELPEIVNIWNAEAIIAPIVFFALGLILPASWLIQDTNIVFHNQPSSGPQELRSASHILLTLLAGYAGISVIVDYTALIGQIYLIYIEALIYPWWWVPPWFIILITLLNPLINLYMPLIVLLAYYNWRPTLKSSLDVYMQQKDIRQLSQLAIITDTTPAQEAPLTPLEKEQ